MACLGHRRRHAHQPGPARPAILVRVLEHELRLAVVDMVGLNTRSGLGPLMQHELMNDGRRTSNRDCRADGSGFATDKSGGWLRRVAGFHSSEDWQIRRTPRAEGPGKFAHGAGNSADDSGGWLLQVSGPGPGIEVDVSGGWLRQDSGCVTMRCVKDPAQHNETRATTDDWKQCLAIANEGGFERMVWMSGVGVGAGGPTWKAKA